MSLQLALDQIQRPTWWFEESNRAEYKNQWTQSDSGKIKKETVLNHIRQAGRADCGQIRRATGYTTQSIRYVTAKLIEDGLIRKVDVSSNRVFWEALGFMVCGPTIDKVIDKALAATEPRSTE